MSQGLDMTVNSLPSRTWNWLKMNESKLKDIETGDTCEVEKIIGASENITGSSVEAAEKKADFSDILTGMGHGSFRRKVRLCSYRHREQQGRSSFKAGPSSFFM